MQQEAAPRGRFITFEGIDGSGKSTQLRRAAAWLRGAGVDCRTTQEPGGTALGEAIRGLFLGAADDSMDGVVEMLLVVASRRQHLIEVIEPALAAGESVLCDRFSDSTVAYQGYGRGLPREMIAVADRLATGGRVPDRTLLFDLPAEVARARRRSGGLNRLDAEVVAFHEAVRQGFLEVAASASGRFRIIDAVHGVEETMSRVRAALADLFPEAAERP